MFMWVRTPATATVFKQEYCTFNDGNTTLFRLEVAFPLQSALVCSTSPSVEAGDAALALVDVDVTAYFLMLRGVGSALLH